MSRGLHRPGADICADCSAAEPKWAVVNRGVLICEECCSIHRSLGRHLSHVKSLKKSLWNPTQLTMVHQLASLGANNIWEYTLHDPSQNKHSKKKPGPKDPVHPTKADFIRAKYQFLTYAYKQKDDMTPEDLNKQLHSSVRTNSLETSLRLLSLGADPNFFNQEKGTCPLHVASQAGQATQVELLLVYGADPMTPDQGGKTPVDYARGERHLDLVDRLIEYQYELTDRLAYYLCGKKPDHRTGQHFIIPEVADRCSAYRDVGSNAMDGMSELAKAAKKKLQALSNTLFEELAVDVYDEVDRRENETIWMSTQNHTSLVSDRQIVPFLPVNPVFSSTRNQGRQKLARFNAREFATLVIDILSDARRRQQGSQPSALSSAAVKPRDKMVGVRQAGKSNSIISDDEPLYDSVASDEDYASIGDNQSLREEAILDKVAQTTPIALPQQSMNSDQSDVPITLEDFLQVKRALAESEARVRQLVQTNKDLKQEITLLHNMVSRLLKENHCLQTAGVSEGVMVAGAYQAAADAMPVHPHPHPNHRGPSNRPMSMFEPRDPQKHHFKHRQQGKSEVNLPAPVMENNGSGGSSQSSLRMQLRPDQQATLPSAESDYDNANLGSRGSSARSSGRSESITPTEPCSLDPGSSTGGGSGGSAEGGGEAISHSDLEDGVDGGMPRQEDVVRKTEKITKKIQELLLSVQEAKHDSYIACAEKIYVAVEDMCSIFPEAIHNESIQAALDQLTVGAERLREQCDISVEECAGAAAGDSQQHTQQVIQCAYEIAKAAKQIVVLFE